MLTICEIGYLEEIWASVKGKWISKLCESFLQQQLEAMNWMDIDSKMGLPRWCCGKELTGQCRSHKRRGFESMGWEDLLEDGMATHSSILAWRIPWVEELGGLQSMGPQRIG